MNLILIIALPIILTVIFSAGSAVVAIFGNDKHKKNLTTEEQIKFEQERLDTLKKIEELKRNKMNVINKNNNKETISNKAHFKDKTNQKTTLKTTKLNNIQPIKKEHKTKNCDIDKYVLENEQSKNNDFAIKNATLKSEIYENQNIDEKQLVFNKDNLVKGLVAIEYLNRKNTRKVGR